MGFKVRLLTAKFPKELWPSWNKTEQGFKTVGHNRAGDLAPEARVWRIVDSLQARVCVGSPERLRSGLLGI
jgi:hypothetical protein